VPDLLLLAEYKLNDPKANSGIFALRFADHRRCDIEIWRPARATEAQLFRSIKKNHEPTPSSSLLLVERRLPDSAPNSTV